MIEFTRMTSEAGHRKFVIITGYNMCQRFYLLVFRGYQAGHSVRRIGSKLDFKSTHHESIINWIETIDFLFKPGKKYIRNTIKDKL